MSSLLVSVRKKMTLTAHRKVRNALEGEYGSVFKGRSMDFDDLRTYSPGDDVKDIDWKATARSGQVLIRRYVAIRKHNILLVVDTGREMAAATASGETKRDVSVMAAGVIAYVAQKHGDLVALVSGNDERIDYLPLKGDSPHIERILQRIDKDTQLQAPVSNVTKLLDYIARTIRRRMMLIIISDNLEFNNEQQRLIRRLGAQHELLFIGIDDLDPSAPAWYNTQLNTIDEDVDLPEHVRSKNNVKKAYLQLLSDAAQQSTHALDRYGISSVRIGSEADVVEQIVRLLEKQKHVRH